MGAGNSVLYQRMAGLVLLACSGAAFFGLKENAQRQSPRLASQTREVVLDELSATTPNLQGPALVAAERGGLIRGSVRAHAGQPLEAATVCVVNASDDVDVSELCVNTDRWGSFVLTVALANTKALLASARGYGSRRHVLDQAAALNEDIVIELDPGGEELSGHVLDAIGGGVIGAVVTLRVNSGATIAATLSGSDGRFAINESTGAAELCAQADAYSRACSEATFPSEGNILILAPESTIVGQVMARATGRPVVGASVIVSNVNGLRIPPRTTSSREDGSFVIGTLPAGGYDIVAVSNNSRSMQQWVAVGLGETSAPVTLWAAPAVRLNGVVLVSGEPCRQGDVELSGPIWARERVLDDGTVRIDGVVPGRYEATASCDPALSQTVSLYIEEKPFEHIWNLETLPASPRPSDAPTKSSPIAGTIRATIEGELGGVGGVFAESQDGAPLRGRRHGRSFIFEGLLAGEYRVYLNDYFEQAQRARIRHDGELIEVRLKSTAPGWLIGRVTSEDGMPVQDAWVSYFRSDSAMVATVAAPPTLTDEEGAFRSAGVPGVPYTLMIASSSGDARVDGIKANEEVLIRVSAPASLSGRVQTADGQSVPEFTLTYRQAHDPQFYQRRCSQSAFHVPMLQPGSYSLRVTSPLGSASREAVLAPGENVSVTMTLTESARASTD